MTEQVRGSGKRVERVNRTLEARRVQRDTTGIYDIQRRQRTNTNGEWDSRFGKVANFLAVEKFGKQAFAAHSWKSGQVKIIVTRRNKGHASSKNRITNIEWA